MIAYEFYWRAERRKTPERITQKSVMNWAKIYFRRNMEMIDMFFFQVTIDKNTGRTSRPFSSEIVSAFREYRWPGNIRELENTIKRIVIFGEEDPILKNLYSKNSEDGINSTIPKNLSACNPAERKSFDLKNLGKKAAEDGARRFREARRIQAVSYGV
jgi:DNA-binding NtrC family response regulator